MRDQAADPISVTPERPDTPDASDLINELESHLATLYPAQSRHGFSVEQLITQQVAFFVARCNGKPGGCGGIMLVGKEYGELKRMYVRPDYRGRGLGMLILDYLSDYAAAQRVSILRLETGIHQRQAIRLYERAGFKLIPPFGAYREDPLSRCYEKLIA